MFDVHGPLFDGEANHAAADMCRAIEREVATEGSRMVHENLHAVLRHPTGYYESHVHAQPEGSNWEITDSGVVYGYWLEGIGSRNFPKTRFKGYTTWRRTTQELDKKADSIVQRVAPGYVRRMG